MELRLIDLLKEVDKDTPITFEFREFNSMEEYWEEIFCVTYKMKDILFLEFEQNEIYELLSKKVIELFSPNNTSDVQIELDYVGEEGAGIKITVDKE